MRSFAFAFLILINLFGQVTLQGWIGHPHPIHRIEFLKCLCNAREYDDNHYRIIGGLFKWFQRILGGL